MCDNIENESEESTAATVVKGIIGAFLGTIPSAVL